MLGVRISQRPLLRNPRLLRGFLFLLRVVRYVKEANKSGTFLFPIGSSEGQWNVIVILTDDDNNQTNLGPNELGLINYLFSK